ncbi:MAG: thermonuclease family protein [Gelidibacter sp.]
MRVFVLLFFISISCFSQTFTGKVVGIMDGDTFKLLTADSTVIKVRLANIDCPEKKQAFSAKATAFTSKAIFGKTVRVKVQSKDRYKRYIANVNYDDNLSLCHELVKNGWAWHYVQYSKDKTLQQMEDKARKSKIGLWQDSNPVAPWEWRDSQKKKKAVAK